MLAFEIRHTLRRTHRIIVLSERLRAIFASDSILDEHISVVWTDLSFALNDPLPGRRLSKDEPVRLLFLSNLIQPKGHYDALEAVAIFRKTTAMRLEAIFARHSLSSADAPLQMSPMKATARFHEYVAENDLQNVGRYVGPVIGKPERRLLETSDFFLLPTWQFTEGQPAAIIEAMAYGCVVISTGYRVIPDMVVDGISGVLIETGRTGALPPFEKSSSNLIATKRWVDRYEKFFTMRRHLDAIIPLLKA